MSAQQDLKAVMASLAAPFDLGEVRFKPVVVSGTRALALAYVDARVIQDRLDQVLGLTGWQDEYDVLEGGGVVCRLKIRLNGQWLIKSDVGSPSEQTDEGDRRKAAFSDALKRAAVKWGVGRYLYRLPPQWIDYDPNRKQFTQVPQLPPWALPGATPPLVNGQTPAGWTQAPPSATSVPDPAGCVNDQQCYHLMGLLAAKGYSTRKLAERYGVRDLRNLTVGQYRHAAASLARLPDRGVLA